MANSIVKYAAITGATSGNNTLVAAVADKKIRVMSLAVQATVAVGFRLEDGAAGTALTGVMEIPTSAPLVLPHNPSGWCETTAATLLNMELDAATQVSGLLTYVEVE